ncbi:DNA replication protein DnaC [Bradyrhizobium japonicum]
MMTMPEIERCLRQLRLSGVRDTLQTRVLQAQGANQPFLETFSLILQDELDRRQSRLIERRYQQSGLDEKLTLAEFDWSFNPKLPRQTCFQLHTLAFNCRWRERSACWQTWHREVAHRQGDCLSGDPAKPQGPVS